MSSCHDEPVLAKAKFAFEGKNNDELAFSKNAIITITQQVDGGWWEGTLDEQTGWFPSNYVVIINEPEKLLRSRSVPNANVLASVSNGLSTSVPDEVSESSSLQNYRTDVLKLFMESEPTYISSVKDTCAAYLLPIKKSSVLVTDDYNTLVSNLDIILTIQTEVLSKVEETLTLESPLQRIGGVLLSYASRLKELFLEYCWNHPKAVEVLNEKESELESFLATIQKDMKGLFMGLSEPFRHLDKYPTLLQELERCTPSNHVDRGDVQRARAVYKDIKVLCEAARKQKQIQLELLHTGQVETWASFADRGKILYVGTTTVVGPKEEKNDRCIAVFTNLVVFLALGEKTNIYTLVKKVRTRGLIVQKNEAGIDFSGVESCSLLIPSPFVVDRWMEALATADGIRVEQPAVVLHRPPTPQKFAVESMNVLSPVRSPEVTQMPSASRARVVKKSSFGIGDMKFDHELEMIVPDFEEDENPRRSRDRRAGAGFTIRPAQLHRVNSLVQSSGKKTIKMRRAPTSGDADDTELLRIVEGYCNGSARAAAAVDSRPPQLIVAEDEKILVEELVGDEVVLQEKSLVDTVYALKDQLSAMRLDLTSLVKTVEREQKARRRLEESLRRGSGLNVSMETASPVSPSC